MMAGVGLPCNEAPNLELLATVHPDHTNSSRNSACDGAQPAPHLFGSRDPGSKSEWLAGLTGVSNLLELGVKLAWGLREELLYFKPARARPTQAATGHRGCLFPLPVQLPGNLKWSVADLKSCDFHALALDCWVAVGCAAINALYDSPNAGFARAPGKVHKAILVELKDKVRRFFEGDPCTLVSFEEVVRDLKDKKVSYSGEEVLAPYPLTAEQILKGLPPAGHGGSVPILPFLKGRTRFLMEHPEESLLDARDRGHAPCSAKVHIAKGSELEVFNLLASRGIISWFPDEKVFSDDRGQYLSGMFGVIKPGKFTESNLPVLRVIMNLIPVNGIFSVLRGDIQSLPSATGWLPLCLSEGEEITMSQGDMSAAFYLFSIPESWSPYFCFNFKVKGDLLGFSGSDRDKFFRPSCVVLPMGWSSSVGIMQAISREILLSKGLPPLLELKKDGAVPPWFAQVTSASTEARSWWQIYLDNFMSADVGGPPHGFGDVELQERAMKAWSMTGVLTAEDKQVLGSDSITELGVRVDGKNGLLGGSPDRFMRTALATIHHLLNPVWSKKEAQIILGRWVFLLQFRRAAMGALSRSWEVLERAWPNPREKDILHGELMMLLCLSPLIQMDLTATYDSEVTCSDASETGGAAAVSKGLTWSGRSLVSMKNDLRLLPIKCPILVVSLFNGIGGSFRAYDILGLVPEGRISVEICKHANRVTRTAWPGTMELLDIEKIDHAEVQRWASLWPHVEELHLFAGFPCVHLSSARAFRKNLEGEGSKLFWKLLEVLQWVQQVFSPFCKVKFCIENVASMDESARDEISSQLGICPVKLDPSDSLPYNRPRFAWVSEPIFEMEGLQLWSEKNYFRAYTTSREIDTKQWIRPGWTWEGGPNVKFPTFMKCIKRSAPPPKPAGLTRTDEATQSRWRSDEYRYPPYQYKSAFLLHHASLPPRVLDSSERELLMGFGPGHTLSCMSASEAKKSKRFLEDVRCSLVGDSFSVFSFAIVASSMAQAYAPRMTPDKIAGRLGLASGATVHPSVEVPLTRWLCYGGDVDKPVQDVEIVQHLGLTVNHTGSDVRIISGALLNQKSQAHASVKAMWWQWKQLFTVKWSQTSHINYLEMKMVLNTLLWKSRSITSIRKRWLHLEDSMVCLYILTKGRTSSHLLQPLANRIGAIQLAMGSFLLHAHVGSAENPTDKGSRL